MERDTPATNFLVTYRGTVYPLHCDHMGHMNVASYVSKFDEASWQLLAALGLTISRLRADEIGMASVDQHVAYKRELCAGTAVSIRSTVLKITERSITVLHEMTNDGTGEIAATTEIVAVQIDTVSRRARVIADDVRDRALRLMGEAACAACVALA
jgi:acyl-CoA thioester hydrolase